MPPQQLAGQRVLVVDDDRLGRKLAELRFGQAGLVVETASTAADAIRMALREPPTVIVSDVRMPGMDGFQLCRAVRGDRRLAAIPIVLLSSADFEEADQAQAQEAGADAFCVRTPELLEAIDALARVLAAKHAPSEGRDSKS